LPKCNEHIKIKAVYCWREDWVFFTRRVGRSGRYLWDYRLGIGIAALHTGRAAIILIRHPTQGALTAVGA
jgi:hypothetical protein